MRKIAFSGMFFLAAASAAYAADPLGDWRDEDGKATIRIIDCNSRLWGVVVGESIPGGTDKNNPDKAKRTRQILGMPVLLNLKKSTEDKDKWEGHVYNAENGKTYEASIQVKSPTSLRVEGCVVWPLCGGQTWTRAPEGAVPVPPPAPGAKTGAAGTPAGTPPAMAPKSTAATPPPPATAPKMPAAKTTAAKGIVATPAVSEYCAIPEIASAPVN